MDERAVLQEQHDDLIQTLPADDLGPKLYSEGLVTPAEYGKFKAAKTQLEKNQILLDALERRPKGFIGKFCRILDKIPGTSHIVKFLKLTTRLKKTERSINSYKAKERRSAQLPSKSAKPEVS